MNYTPITPERLRAAMAKTKMSLMRHATVRGSSGCAIGICGIAEAGDKYWCKGPIAIGKALGLPDGYAEAFAMAFDLGHWNALPDSELKKDEERKIDRYTSLEDSPARQGFIDGLVIRDEFIFKPELRKIEEANR